jgi:hypothetical protein
MCNAELGGIDHTKRAVHVYYDRLRESERMPICTTDEAGGAQHRNYQTKEDAEAGVCRVWIPIGIKEDGTPYYVGAAQS